MVPFKVKKFFTVQPILQLPITKVKCFGDIILQCWSRAAKLRVIYQRYKNLKL